MDITKKDKIKIAKFMEAEIIEKLKWDWLIPIVEKIGEELGYRVTISTTFTRIYCDENKEIEYRNLDGMLQTTYMAVTDFINWHSKLKK